MPHYNHLSQETSAYLLQHAGNPVHWYPWGEPALERARLENKPILLSIGYSACHWCHVMARESFEDAATAEIMNSLFINIKVDREERPDLDKIYQLAHSILMRRGGGWPLTLFLTPNQIPFFGGTYFPDQPRHGLPAFKDLLQRISVYLLEHPHDIVRQNESMLVFFQSLNARTTVGTPHAEMLTAARNELLADFDTEYGGFGAAPKFPHTPILERALRHSARSDPPDAALLHAACFTLEHMAHSGLYDQLGGGFYRYSVDERWEIPHFEKMLYDNALLLAVYANAYQITGIPLFKHIAAATASWILREMQSAAGAYFSALDADTEHEEGKFYLWSRSEVENLLSQDEYRVAARHFGLDKPANFEAGWHLNMAATTAQLATSFSLPLAEIEAILARASGRMLHAREQRIRPGRDEKILTAWNALTIRGLAITGRALQNDGYLQAAKTAFEFIQKTLWQKNRLLAVYAGGTARFSAYLDDHAFLLDAAIELLQSKWHSGYLQFSIALADTLLAHFEDTDYGSFYFTADDHETLIHRSKSSADDATPAGAAIAAFALHRLGSLLAEPRYLSAAERAVNSTANAIEQAPSGHCSFLHAVEAALDPPEIFLLRTPVQETPYWQTQAARHYSPQRLIFVIPADAKDLPSALASKAAQANTVLYRCKGLSCTPAENQAAQIERLLEGSPAS